jgi:hypothetical protein
VIDLEIEIPDMQSAFEADFGRSIGPEEEAVLEEFAGLLVEAVVAVWPVRTGLSASAWEAEPMPPPAIGIRLFNGVEYSPFVHLAGEPAEPPLWTQIVAEIQERIPGPLGRALWAVADSAPGGRMPTSSPLQRRPSPPASAQAVLTVYEGG